jgi:hypothetical protein
MEPVRSFFVTISKDYAHVVVTLSPPEEAHLAHILKGMQCKPTFEVPLEGDLLGLMEEICTDADPKRPSTHIGMESQGFLSLWQAFFLFGWNTVASGDYGIFRSGQQVLNTKLYDQAMESNPEVVAMKLQLLSQFDVDPSADQLTLGREKLRDFLVTSFQCGFVASVRHPWKKT